jgi:signal transduction histidine kinase
MSVDSTTAWPPAASLSAADLETVLDAWQAATVSLEQTHRALSDEVKRLTDELEIKNRELARKNRLADLGQMASHVAHEVRNNLVPVALYLSLLKRRVAREPESLELVGKIETGMTSLDSMVNDLLHFTIDREPKRTWVVVRDLIDEVVSSLQLQLAAQAIAVDLYLSRDLELFVDRDMLRRAVLNLTLNAIDAMPDGGRIMYSGLLADDGMIEIHVADNGPGLSNERVRRAFEPFYTTKNTGTGLGLAIVWRVAEAHGGTCSLRNASSGGAVFTLRLPATARQEAAA